MPRDGEPARPTLEVRHGMFGVEASAAPRASAKRGESRMTPRPHSGRGPRKREFAAVASMHRGHGSSRAARDHRGYQISGFGGIGGASRVKINANRLSAPPPIVNQCSVHTKAAEAPSARIPRGSGRPGGGDGHPERRGDRRFRLDVRAGSARVRSAMRITSARERRRWRLAVTRVERGDRLRRVASAIPPAGPPNGSVRRRIRCGEPSRPRRHRLTPPSRAGCPAAEAAGGGHPPGRGRIVEG